MTPNERFRKFWTFPAKPGQLDKADSTDTAPQADRAEIQGEDSVLQEGGVLVYPQVDAWPESIFSGVPEVGQGPEQIADSLADKTRRDQVYGRIYSPPQAYNAFRITSNSPSAGTGQNIWQVKTSTAVLHSLIVANAGTNWIVSIFDGLQTSQPEIRYLSAMGLGVFTLNIKFFQSLVITATGTAGELVVTYL